MVNENVETSMEAKITELPTKVSQNALEEIIESDPRFTGKDYAVEFDKASGKGDNYLGELFRIKVQHSSDVLNVVAKLAPVIEVKNEESRPMYHREALFYEEVNPIFKKFQEDKGIYGKDGFYEVPSCLKSVMTEFNECIFMEDLKVTGFEMFDRFKEMTVENSNETMKVLGKLHALSFAIKDQNKDLLQPFTSIFDVLTQGNMDASMSFWFGIITKKALDSLVDYENKEVVEKVKKVLETPFRELFTNAVDGKLSEYSVICHGDCWNNNVMYRSENGIAVEARLLDWQIMRYSSPVLDMLYYIFCCTTKDFRDKHYEEILDTYYTSLSTFMTKLGSNPEKLFPRKAFEQELVKFGKFGMLMAMFVLPIFVSTVTEIPDIMTDSSSTPDEMEATAKQFGSGKVLHVYNKRMQGVFEDAVRLNYI